MRICFITNLNSIHAIRWIQPLIDAEHEVYVVTYSQNNLPLSGAKYIINLTHQTNLPKIRFAIWGMRIRSYVKAIQPDILHAHQIPAAGWIGAMTGFHPFVVTGWGSDFLIEPHKSIFRKMLTRIVLSRTDYITIPSKIMYNAAYDLGFPEDRLFLIPWGVETNIFKPDNLIRRKVRQRLNLQEDTPVLFCPRGIRPVYNIDIVIEACHSIKQKYPDLRLLLLNYNILPEYQKKLGHLIASANMETNVIWSPAQTSTKDMASFYQASDIIISLPSSEGYGFSPYEGMACGIPTIISDLPVFQDDLCNRIHVLKVPVRDSHKTAIAIESIFEDGKLRKMLIENSISKCASLSVQNRIEQVEVFYKKILDY
jgi:glycosyltransferase involved in cell wall biosynthesis